MTLRRLALAAPLFLAAAAAARAAGWGDDVKPGAGPALIVQFRPDLVEIVKAPDDKREALARAFANLHGAEAIEALKRFRNPELKPVFLALLASPEWKLRHRALDALERLGDPTALPAAWALLTHPHARLREKAAIACITLWDPAAAKALPVATPADIVADLKRREDNDQVRRCLDALGRRIAGTLSPLHLGSEFVRTLDDGLKLTPFVDGFARLAAAAPGYTPRATSQPGGGSASGLPLAESWLPPLMDFRTEEVAGAPLVPFAGKTRDGTANHAGLDAGACCDGSGIYACAEGIVRLLAGGGETGGTIVLEHHTGDPPLVNTVYLHAGDTVFVRPGDRVSEGQLLGTIGLGWSVENGGRVAHLHLGLYPGPFVAGHTYEEKPVKDGLLDWLDPGMWLSERVEATRPLVPEVRSADARMEPIAALVERKEYGKAFAEAQKLADAAGTAATTANEARAVCDAIRKAPAVLVPRLDKRLADGFPLEAVELLKRAAARFKGAPGAVELEDKLKAWGKDPLVNKALAGEREFLVTDAEALELAAKKTPRPQLLALWDALFARYGDTCLAGRLKRKIEQAR